MIRCTNSSSKSGERLITESSYSFWIPTISSFNRLWATFSLENGDDLLPRSFNFSGVKTVVFPFSPSFILIFWSNPFTTLSPFAIIPWKHFGSGASDILCSNWKKIYQQQKRTTSEVCLWCFLLQCYQYRKSKQWSFPVWVIGLWNVDLVACGAILQTTIFCVFNLALKKRWIRIRDHDYSTFCELSAGRIIFEFFTYFL